MSSRLHLFILVTFLGFLLLACGDAAEEQGGLNEPCYPNGTCDSPFVCEDGLCAHEESDEQGGLGQPCYPNDTCDSPYICEDGLCGHDEEEDEEGGLGQPCYPDGSCDSPYVCEDGVCGHDQGGDDEGGLGQPCYPDGSCDSPYVCEDGVCMEEDEPAPICEPGELIDCHCADGTEGVAICEEDGMSHSECDCSDHCVPITSCDDLETAECGVQDDGCGGTLDCGGCDWYLVCRESVCVDPLDTVSVPAGTFEMGCNTSVDNQCEQREYPTHAVSVPAFEIDIYQATVQLYEICVQDGDCSTPTGSNWNAADRMEHPVTKVDWHQAKEYCEWAGKRLCTEAEWEMAARGTYNRKFPWGNDEPTCDLAVFNPVGQTRGCGEGSTWPVGSMPAGASPRGTLDMSGNLWDWVEDDYHMNYNGAPTDGSAWIDSPRAQYRVLRGGSFDCPAKDLRASARDYARPTASGTWDHNGIRCCR